MTEVTIVDQGNLRRVEIRGEHREYGRLVPYSTSFATQYSCETLERILAVKGGTWLKDELDRSEAPGYLQAVIQHLFGRFVSFTGKLVLDFGCGCGATSVVLARMGASVVGVDPDGPSVHAARRRLRDVKASGSTSFSHVRETHRLPFPDSVFDVVMCYQVLEHILPSQRRSHVQEMWRVIRPGGHLLVSVPNRLWPIEFHTTGLWFVAYLPSRLARQYAVLRGRLPAAAIQKPALAEGMQGVTYWGLLRWLPKLDAKVLNVQQGDDLQSYFTLSLSRPQSGLNKLGKRALRGAYQMLDQLFWRPLSIPAGAFLPYLAICVEKRAMDFSRSSQQ